MLLLTGIALAGKSIISLRYGVVVLLVTSTPPLLSLCIGFLASIPAAIFFTIASGKITELVGKMIGAMKISPGVVVQAWMGLSFYLSTWLGTGLSGLLWALVLRGLLRSPVRSKSKSQGVESHGTISTLIRG